MFQKWSKDLTVKTQRKTSVFLKFLKLLKFFLMFSMIITVFWGMGTLIFDPDVAIKALGEPGKTDFIPGVFIEYAPGLEEPPAQTIVLHITKNTNNEWALYQYDYNLVYSWSDVAKYVICPFYIVFVYPVSWLFTKLCLGFGYDLDNVSKQSNVFVVIGSLFLITFFMRLINFYGSWKTLLTQEKMKKIQPKINEIKAKYSKNLNMSNRQIQQNEIMNLYKKYNISPLGSSMQTFAFAPFLFVVFAVVRTSYLIKATDFKEETSENILFSFSQSVWQGFKNSNFKNWRYYLITFVYFFLLGTKFFVPWVFHRKEPKITVQEPVANLGGMFGKFNRGKILKIVFQLFFIYIFFSVVTGVSIYFTFGLFFEVIQKVLFEFLFKKKKQLQLLKKKGIETNIWKVLFSIKK